MGTKSSKIGPMEYVTYGMGNFASQLSWTMVTTYLAVFYTDVFGLSAGSVAVLFLIAKVWSGVSDPLMGALMERTHTRFGRFRPYIVIGAPLLVLFTVLTFTVPGFGSKGKLIYAYITYIGLGMSYTIANVPYLALPGVMTTDSKKINRLNTAQMMGMVFGMILLNLVTLPLVNHFGGGDMGVGYQRTASVFALIALPIFWMCAWKCKETVQVHKEDQVSLKESAKLIVQNKNLMMIVLYTILNMAGMLGRIGVAVYFYLYVVKNFTFITIFMMMQMLVGAVIMPFSPKVMERFGKKKTIYFSGLIQVIGLLMMVFGPYMNIPYLFLCHIVYGLGYIAGPCGSCMIVDAVDDGDLKTGVRTDGTAFSLNGLGGLIGTALGGALGIAIIGWYGYVAGQEITEHVKTGIIIATNVMPAIIFILSLIPIACYKLKESDMTEIREKLRIRNEQRDLKRMK